MKFNILYPEEVYTSYPRYRIEDFRKISIRGYGVVYTGTVWEGTWTSRACLGVLSLVGVDIDWSIEVNMDNPNITMEEYIRLEEEKARRRGKVYNWETATYGKIWDNENVQDLGSIETEFPAIVFNDTLTSEATLSCEPTVSSLNDEIDFRISFDESDDEDCTVIFDKNSFSYKIIYVNDLKTDSENDNYKANMPSIPSPKPTISYFDDLDFFKDFENEFSAIVTMMVKRLNQIY
ncbi:hypothetical protein Tco_0285001 [Tanacetum coccineum]